MPAVHAVEVQGLRKIYKQARPIVALDGIDLAIRGGELFGILGPNGAGKTTTISVCTTHALPTEGRVSIAGIDVQREPARARRFLGVVTQFNTLDRSLTVAENLYFHCRYFGFCHTAAQERTREVLEQFGLTERAKAFPAHLSGGLAQRVQLARALAHRPRVLFLDEPSAGLDPQTRVALWDAIRAMRAAGVTIVLSTHYIQEADLLCDRVAIIDQGRVLACGSPAELKQSTGVQTMFEITVSGPRNGLEGNLRQLPGVAAVEATPSGFRVLSAGRDGLLPQIVDAAHGKALRDIIVTEPNLETVFISLTGRGLRA